MTPSAAALDRVRVERGGLYKFVQLAWNQIEHSAFVPNWHLEEMAVHLEAVYRCEIRNLVINIPPGCGKSLIVSVFWPVWVWLLDPSFRWIAGSFDASLVGKRDGSKIVQLARSEWFRERWGQILPDGPTSLYDLQTTSGGFRFATSPGGKGIGRHANGIIVDDPCKPIDTLGTAAITKKNLTKVHEWRSQTLSMRQADPKTTRNVLVMQRLSAEDPTAETLATVPDVVHLRLPMRYEAAHPCVTGWGGDRRTREGELLYPERFDEIAVRTSELALDKGAAAQLQQRPTMVGGGIFRRANWRFWSRAPRNEPCMCETCFTAKRSVHDTGRACATMPEAGLDFMSWDMSFKGKATSDFVAGGAWRAAAGRLYLRDAVNARLSFSLAKAQVLLYETLYPCPRSRILVEDAANGSAIVDELGVKAVPNTGGKVALAHAAEPMVRAELVYLPHPDECPVIWILLHQVEAFPATQFDDLVDMLSHAVTWYRQQSAAGYLDRLARLLSK